MWLTSYRFGFLFSAIILSILVFAYGMLKFKNYIDSICYDSYSSIKTDDNKINLLKKIAKLFLAITFLSSFFGIETFAVTFIVLLIVMAILDCLILGEN